MANEPFRILTLDGGGSKGVFTLGVLEELEAAVGASAFEVFDLIYGTSTGAIIAALLSLGWKAQDIRDFYISEIPGVMRWPFARMRSHALRAAGENVFGDAGFDVAKTRLGIVASDVGRRKPIIFKSAVDQAHGRQATFVPGFGATLVDAVMASAAAVPFFRLARLHTPHLGVIEAIDGGFTANNPSLYAIADAVNGVGRAPSAVRTLNIGVGQYPLRTGRVARLLRRLPSVQLLERTIQINTASMSKLVSIVYGDVKHVRVDRSLTGEENATNLLEADRGMLQRMNQAGRDAFGAQEQQIVSLVQA